MKKFNGTMILIVAAIMILTASINVYAAQKANAIENTSSFSASIPGDMNQDGALNSADAIYLLRHSLLPEFYPINESGDVNGDGQMNSADAIYLLRHTLLPNMYPLAGPSATDEKYFTFTLLSDGTYSVKANTAQTLPSEVIIPSEYNGKAVTQIAHSAFANCQTLQSITIPANVKQIDSGVFDGCSALKNILVDTNNANYSSLGGDLYSKDQTKLLQYALGKEESSFAIPSGVKMIGSNAFARSLLTSVEIPASVTAFESGIFSQCPHLKNIAFMGTRKQWEQISKSIYWDNNMEDYSVTFPMDLDENYLRFNSYDRGETYWVTGSDSQNMPEHIVIPATYRGKPVTRLYNRAFWNCKTLKSITLPETITSIDGGVFSGCTSLENIYVDEKNPNYTSIDGNVYETRYRFLTLVVYAPGKKDASFEVPDHVDTIGGGAFYGCDYLQSVTLPNGVTTIGTEAFFGCSNLQSVTLSENLHSIYWNAFAYCTSLQNITLPESVQYIRDDAFKNCEALTHLEIPSSVREIGAGIFVGCKNLQSIVFPNSITKMGVVSFEGCKNIESVTLPNCATEIAEKAFYYCNKLKTVTLPANLKVIGDSAFNGCHALETLALPNGLTSIGKSAFEKCKMLKNIHIPESVISIGTSAFYGCKQLTSIEFPDGITVLEDFVLGFCTNMQTIMIPESVKKIGYQSFVNCQNLKNIVFGGTRTEWDAVEKVSVWGDSWDSNTGDYTITYLEEQGSVGLLYTDMKDGSYAVSVGTCTDAHIVIPENYNGKPVRVIKDFSDCKILQSITIPESVDTIGQGAFIGCKNLQSITIPNGIKNLPNLLFYNCQSLQSITIPNSVTSIGNSAFHYCYALKNITFTGTKAEWNSINKGSQWDANSNYFVVHCTDGDIKKGVYS